MSPFGGVLRIFGCVAALLAAGTAAAQSPADFFKQSCASCHTIGGGRLVGPDLKDVTKRKDAAWLIEFMLAPQRMIDSGDAYALKLRDEARGVVMPPVAGMDRAKAAELLKFIEAQSGGKSQFGGSQVSDRPFTAADIEQGRLLLTGERKLANGGPACLGCHTMKGLGLMGGGRLGPDLTRVYERLSGRKNLSAWLAAPATPTMAAVFRNHALTDQEIPPLIAVFEQAARAGGEDNSASRLVFLLFGLGAAAAGLVVFDIAWRRRFRAVRAPLAERRRGAQNEVD